MTYVERTAASVAIMAFAGGVARLFYSYHPDMTRMQMGRILATSFYVGVVVGLLVWEPLEEVHPTLLIALIAAVSWLGVDLARTLFELIVRRLLGGKDVTPNGL